MAGLVVDDQHKQEKESVSSEKDVTGGGVPKENGASPKMEEAAAATTLSPKKGVGFVEEFGGGLLSFVGLGGSKPAAGAEDAASPSTQKQAGEEEISKPGGVRSLVGSKHADESPDSSVHPTAAQEPKAAEIAETKKRDEKTPKYMDDTETDSTDTSEPLKAADVSKLEQAEEETTNYQYGRGTNESNAAQVTSKAEDPGKDASERTPIHEEHESSKSSSYFGGVLNRVGKWTGLDSQVEESRQAAEQEVPSSHVAEANELAARAEEAASPPAEQEVTPSHIAEANEPAARAEEAASQPAENQAFEEHVSESVGVQKVGQGVLSLFGLGGSKPASGAENPAVEERLDTVEERLENVEERLNSRKSAHTEKLRDGAKIKQDYVKSPKSVDATHIDGSTDTPEPPKAVDVAALEQAKEETPKPMKAELEQTAEETPKSQDSTGTDESKTAQVPSKGEDPGTKASEWTPILEEDEPSKPSFYFGSVLNRVGEWTGIDFQAESGQAAQQEVPPSHIDDANELAARAEEAEEVASPPAEKPALEEEASQSVGVEQAGQGVLSFFGLGGSKSASGAEKPAVEERNSSKSADTEKVGEGAEQGDVKSPKSADATEMNDSTDTREPPKALDATESEQAPEEALKGVNPKLEADRETPKSTDESKTAQPTSNAEDSGTGFRVLSLLGPRGSKPASDAEKPAVEERLDTVEERLETVEERLKFRKSAHTRKLREGAKIRQDDVKSPKSFDPTDIDDSTDTPEPPKAVDVAAFEQATEETPKPMNAALEQTEEETPKSEDATGTDESRTAEITSKGVDSGTDASERTPILEEHEPFKQSSSFGTVLNRVGKWTGRDSQAESQQAAEQVSPSHIAETKEPATRAEEMASPLAENPALEEDTSQSVGVENVGQGVLSFLGLGGFKSASGAEKPAVEERNYSKSADTEKVGEGAEVKQSDFKSPKSVDATQTGDSTDTREPPEALDVTESEQAPEKALTGDSTDTREPPEALDVTESEQAPEKALKGVNAELEADKETPKSQYGSGTDESKTAQPTSSAEDPGKGFRVLSLLGLVSSNSVDSTETDDSTDTREPPKALDVTKSEQAAEETLKAVNPELEAKEETPKSQYGTGTDESKTAQPTSSAEDPGKRFRVLSLLGLVSSNSVDSTETDDSTDTREPPKALDVTKSEQAAEETLKAVNPELEAKEEIPKSQDATGTDETKAAQATSNVEDPGTPASEEAPIPEEDESSKPSSYFGAMLYRVNKGTGHDPKVERSNQGGEREMPVSDITQPDEAPRAGKIDESKQAKDLPMAVDVEIDDTDVPKTPHVSKDEDFSKVPNEAEKGEETPAPPSSTVVEKEETDPSNQSPYFGGILSRVGRWTGRTPHAQQSTQAAERNIPSSPTADTNKRAARAEEVRSPAEKPALEEEVPKFVDNTEKVGEGLLSLVGLGGSKPAKATEKPVVEDDGSESTDSEEGDVKAPKSLDATETDDSTHSREPPRATDVTKLEHAAEETPKPVSAELEQAKEETPKSVNSELEQAKEETPKSVNSELEQAEEEIPKPVRAELVQAGEEIPKSVEAGLEHAEKETPKFGNADLQLKLAKKETSKSVAATETDEFTAAQVTSKAEDPEIDASAPGPHREEHEPSTPSSYFGALLQRVEKWTGRDPRTEDSKEGAEQEIPASHIGGANKPAARAEEAASPPAEKPAPGEEVSKSVGIDKVGEGVLSLAGLAGSAPAPGAQKPAVEKEDSKPGGVENVGDGILSLGGLRDSNHGDDTKKSPVDLNAANGPKAEMKEDDTKDPKSVDGIEIDDSPNAHELKAGQGAELEQSEDQTPRFRADAGRDESDPDQATSKEVGPSINEESDSGVIDKVGKDVLSAVSPKDSKSPEIAEEAVSPSVNRPAPRAEERASSPAHQPAAEDEVSEAGGVENVGKGEDGASPPAEEPALEKKVSNKSVGIEKVGEGVHSAVDLGGSKATGGANEAASSPVEEAASPPADEPKEVPNKSLGIEEVGEGVLSAVGLGGSKSTGGAHEAASSPVEKEAASPPADEPIVEKEVSHSGGIEKVEEGAVSLVDPGDSQPGAEKPEAPAVERDVPKSVGVEKVGEGVLSTVGLGDSKPSGEAEETSSRSAEETSSRSAEETSSRSAEETSSCSAEETLSPAKSDVEKEDSSSRGVEKVGAGVLSLLQASTPFLKWLMVTSSIIAVVVIKKIK